MNTDLQAKLEEAAKRAKSRDDKAEAIIWANVLFNAGLGALPFVLNIWPFIGSNVTTIIALGHLYGFTANREQAGVLMRQIISTAGMTVGAYVVAERFFSEVLKGVGIFTGLGAPFAIVGLALDTITCGAISYALGYTAKVYFSRGCVMDKAEMRREFRARFEEGKAKVAAARKPKEASS